jgi:chemotaxis protein MotB
MSYLSKRRRTSEMNYWPGFVDALSTLLLAIVFMLSVFMLAQFILSQEIAGRDTVLTRLNQRITELSDLLSLERTGRKSAEELSLQIQSTLRLAEAERSRLQGIADTGAGKAGALTTELDNQKIVSARALSQIEILNQQLDALRRQLAALEEALGAAEAREKDAQGRISDLGLRLNTALAQRVQELARYRSDFFGRLRQILGERTDIRIVGDRFVFQSEVLFPAGQATLRPEAIPEIERVANAILELERQIPLDIPWILRIDGHTDTRPIATVQFPNNWSLSAARAIAVVQALSNKGVAPQRLLAAGFGEFQPLDAGTNDEAYKRNRRIEIKLTER